MAYFDNSGLVVEGSVRAILALAGSDDVLSVTICVAFTALSFGSSDISTLLVCFLINKGYHMFCDHLWYLLLE